MPASTPKPPYDPEMTAFLAAWPAPVDITFDMIPGFRKNMEEANTAATVLAGDETFTHSERAVPGPSGPVTLSIFRPKSQTPSRTLPCVFYLHGGGMLFGNRFTGLKDALRWAKATGAVCVSVEYRHTPEHAYPAPLDDCWAALQWVSAHASELGISPDRLLVGGQSAGGNLAAALALLARDRGGPKIAGSLLDCPMLDDRLTTTSSRQYVGEGTWSRDSGIMAWGAYLGPNVGKPGVSPYAAPARALDLKGLPPTFIGVGAAELFRDESVDYASRLWEAGGDVELHVWPGVFHCFDMLMPDHPTSVRSTEEKVGWAKKILAEKPAAKL